jgi:hypothetical protein
MVTHPIHSGNSNFKIVSKSVQDLLYLKNIWHEKVFKSRVRKVELEPIYKLNTDFLILVTWDFQN